MHLSWDTQKKEWQSRFIQRDSSATKRFGGLWVVYKNKRRGF